MKLLVSLWVYTCMLYTLLMCIGAADIPESVVDYCENESYEARCHEKEVIIMTFAKYGRMEKGRCITQSYGHIGCNVDVLDILDGFCSGKMTCKVDSSNKALVDKKQLSCPRDLAGYLQTAFKCVKVSAPENCNQAVMSIMHAEMGFASHSECPLVLQPLPGKRVNITMYGFPPRPSGTSQISSSACYEVGTITEGQNTQTIHKCLTDSRHRPVYVSQGGEVVIKLSNKNSADITGEYMLHYQVFGCRDPIVPENTQLKRVNNEAMVTCEASGNSWKLVCNGDTWTGSVGECHTDIGWSFLGLFDSSHPYGTAIVVGVGATLGVLTGGILLFILISIFKKCQKDESRNYDYADASFTHAPLDYMGNKHQMLLQDDFLDQKFATLGTQHGLDSTYPYNSNTINRDNTNHSRVPLPPLPNGNNTLSYEKPLYNRNNIN